MTCREISASGVDSRGGLVILSNMTTTHQAPDYRRQCLRLTYGTLTADEFISYLSSPWVDMTPKAPTEAQWREIGKINGMVAR